MDPDDVVYLYADRKVRNERDAEVAEIAASNTNSA
jgi:hypothetical protein